MMHSRKGGFGLSYLRTSQVAGRTGIHPNTVRLYEEWGFLPPIERTPKGYRKFSEYHVDQIRLIRLALSFTFLSGEVRKTSMEIIRLGALRQLGAALEQAQRQMLLIRSEHRRAEEAVEILEQWVRNFQEDIPDEVLHIRDVTGKLDITYDMLRNWERNGMIKVPRDPDNGYRIFHRRELNRLRIIRILRRARYSTMSILRMLRSLDAGRQDDLRLILDTPDPEEDIVYATDHWLSTVKDLAAKAGEMTTHLEYMADRYGAGDPEDSPMELQN